MDVAFHLDRFFRDISVDARVTVTHISVYAAILQSLRKVGTNRLSMFGRYSCESTPVFLSKGCQKFLGKVRHLKVA
jgi:hypothetical protein